MLDEKVNTSLMSVCWGRNKPSLINQFFLHNPHRSRDTKTTISVFVRTTAGHGDSIPKTCQNTEVLCQLWLHCACKESKTKICARLTVCGNRRCSQRYGSHTHRVDVYQETAPSSHKLLFLPVYAQVKQMRYSMVISEAKRCYSDCFCANLAVSPRC